MRRKDSIKKDKKLGKHKTLFSKCLKEMSHRRKNLLQLSNAYKEGLSQKIIQNMCKNIQNRE